MCSKTNQVLRSWLIHGPLSMIVSFNLFLERDHESIHFKNGFWLEVNHVKKTGKLVSLSEQNLVDCSGCLEFDDKNRFLHEDVMDCGFKYLTNLYVYNKANIGSIKRQCKTLKSKTIFGARGRGSGGTLSGKFWINYLRSAISRFLRSNLNVFDYCGVNHSHIIMAVLESPSRSNEEVI